jgi:hypothetical protein
MQSGYKFQIGLVRVRDEGQEKHIRIGWAPVTVILAAIAAALWIIPLYTNPAPAPVAHVQRAPLPSASIPLVSSSPSPSPSPASTTGITVAAAGNRAVCIVPTGKLPHEAELVRVP